MMGLGKRAVPYVVLSAGVVLSLALDVLSDRYGMGRAAVYGAVLCLALWSSFPRWRATLLAQLAMSATLLVAANLLLSPLVVLTGWAEMPTLPANLHRNIHVSGEVLAGYGARQTVTTDARGHRTNGPIDYDRKPPGALRIALFGASTTEEAMLDDRRTWSVLLGDALAPALGRKVEIVNAAVSGTRVPHQLAAFQASEAYAPDVAIFLMGINDWNHAVILARETPVDTARRLLVPAAFSLSVLRAGLIRLHTALANGLRGAKEEVEQEDGSFFVEEMAQASRRPKTPFRLATVDQPYRDGVAAIFAECRRRGIPCFFVEQATAYDPTRPDRWQFWMTPPHRRYALSVADLRATADLYNGWLKEAVEAAGFPFCPTVEGLPPTPAVFVDDCHYTEHGSRLLAGSVSACLMKSQLLQRLAR